MEILHTRWQHVKLKMKEVSARAKVMAWQEIYLAAAGIRLEVAGLQRIARIEKQLSHSRFSR